MFNLRNFLVIYAEDFSCENEFIYFSTNCLNQGYLNQKNYFLTSPIKSFPIPTPSNNTSSYDSDFSTRKKEIQLHSKICGNMAAPAQQYSYKQVVEWESHVLDWSRSTFFRFDQVGIANRSRFFRFDEVGNRIPYLDLQTLTYAKLFYIFTF